MIAPASAEDEELESILMEDERVPCLFTVDALGLGHLDPSLARSVRVAPPRPPPGAHEEEEEEQDGEDEDGVQMLPAGSRVDLPLWLAAALKTQGAVELDMPLRFGSKIRDDLAAGAQAVNLRELSYHYFRSGKQVALLQEDEGLEQTLRRAISGGRFSRVMNFSLNSRNEDITSFKSVLTSVEERMFAVGYMDANEYKDWKARRFQRLTASRVLQHASKRRKTR